MIVCRQIVQLILNEKLTMNLYLFIILLLLVTLLTDSESKQYKGGKVIEHNVCEYVRRPLSDKVPYQLYYSGGMKEFFCDTETSGGGWIVFQSRKYAVTSFNRTWDEYKKGFGTCHADYWLGNEFVHQLTSFENYELRIDMKFRNMSFYVQYGRFKLGSEANHYALTVEAFKGGNVLDIFTFHSGNNFSTPERDNDNMPGYNCAEDYGSGWWFVGCHSVHLNAPFTPNVAEYHGLFYYSLTGRYDSLSETQMKIRAARLSR